MPTETRDTVGIRRENVRGTGPRELFGGRPPLAVPVARIELGTTIAGPELRVSVLRVNQESESAGGVVPMPTPLMPYTSAENVGGYEQSVEIVIVLWSYVNWVGGQLIAA